ncbi:MAG: ATP synthase F1 subunit gamma [Clostridia bacterium]|nr:ATP synthase F1 subunit gamma [Clostridia bacterium]
MGADIKKLRSRIKSIDSTLHLTKAMGLVASSKIRRATDNMNKAKEYTGSLSDVVNMLTGCGECAKSPYMQKHEQDRLCLLVIAGDRGLAGGYNANVFRMEKETSKEKIIPIGKRACERYGESIRLVETFSYEQALSMAKEICDDFANGTFDRVAILCTKYISIMSQEPQIRPILPLVQGKQSVNHTVLFEPDEATILNSLVREYVASVIYAAVRESYASEVAARRFAMDSAGKNAEEMMSRLKLQYNRARQGAITQEITEIVAGSDT